MKIWRFSTKRSATYLCLSAIKNVSFPKLNSNYLNLPFFYDISTKFHIKILQNKYYFEKQGSLQIHIYFYSKIISHEDVHFAFVFVASPLPTRWVTEQIFFFIKLH